MAKNNETTTKFKVDISELVSGMQKAKRQIALANAEFKAGTAGMDKWASTADGVRAKCDQLGKTLDAQEDILKALEKQYELTAKQMGADSKEAENLKIKIENQKASVTKTKKELENYTKTLKKLEDGVEDTTEALDDMDDKARDAGDGFTVFKGAVATFAGNLATSAVTGIKNLAGSILSLSESTKEYRDTMNKLNTAGADAGYGADYTKKKYEDLYGVLGDETATATTVSNFMAMNAEQSTLDSLLNSSIGIWAKYGDSIPLDGLAESINETAKVGAVTGGLADALNWAGINEDKFNEKLEKCTSEQERQKLIADTLNKTYGDLSASYQETNASVIEANKANASYTESMAEMGARVEPITTSIREGFTKIIQKILELTEGVDFNAIATGIAGAFDYFINTILPKIVDGLQWVIDHKDIILAGIVGIGTAFLTWKVVGLITSITNAIKAMMIATEGATVAQKLLNLAMKANPIGIVITLIMGLVSAFVVLWNKSDAFREFFINLWDGIKDFLGGVVDAIGGFFSGMWDGVKNGAKSAWNGIKSTFSNVANWFGDIFSKAWKKVKDVFSVGGKIFDGIKDGIVNAFKGIVNGIIKGINKVVALPFNAINKVLKSLKKIDILGVEPFGWLGTIDVPQIPLLAKGTVVDKPTLAMIGEAGKEAVVPLENNTGWLDEVASRIVSKGGIVGGTAQTVNNNYNYEFNQTNNSPKSLSRLDIYRQTKNQLAFAKGV